VSNKAGLLWSEAVVQFMGETISPHIATEIKTVSCKGNCTQYLITSSFKLFAIAAQDIYSMTAQYTKRILDPMER